MKILWFGSSNDAGNFLEPSERVPFLAARRLSEELGIDFEVETRKMWPTARMPDLVERWLKEVQPDLVVLTAVTFWVSYESVPLKIQRRLGRLSKPITAGGVRASKMGWLSSTSAFHATRKLAHRTIGGVTHFETDEVLERMSAAIRLILRDEGTALYVRGPRGGSDYHGFEKARIRSEERRQRLHQGLRSVCQDLHVVYDGNDVPLYKVHNAEHLGDRLHTTAAEQPLRVEGLLPFLIQAWDQQHARDGKEPAAHR